MDQINGLGLPDYYDYDDDIGPKGGVGGMDIMGGWYGGHGAFSKFMLDWIEPQVLTEGEYQYEFAPAHSSKDALIIMPGINDETRYDEYFMVEYRRREANDKNFPSDGTLIWHIDASLQEGTNYFKNDNSFTDNKLIRLVQADGLAEIEQGTDSGDAGDFFNKAQSFSFNTNPASHKNDGTTTGIDVKIANESESSATYMATIHTLPSLNHNLGNNNQVVSNTVEISASAQHQAGILNIELHLGDQLLKRSESNEVEYQWDTTQYEDGTYNLTLTATNSNGLSTEVTKKLHILNSQAVLIADLSLFSQLALESESISTTLTQLDVPHIKAKEILNITPEQVPVMFVKMGYYPLARALTSPESSALIDYINAGGKLYLEGADLWFYDDKMPIHSLFGITGVSDGSAENPSYFIGQEGTVTEGLSFYNYENTPYVDTLEIDPSVGTSTVLWTHESPEFHCTISTITETYRLIGSSCSFDSIMPDKRGVIMSAYLEQLDYQINLNNTIQFRDTNLYLGENFGSFEVYLTRYGSLDDSLSVNYSTIDDSAKSGQDYQAQSGTITFEPGEVEQKLKFYLIDNEIYDNSRQFFIQLDGEAKGQNSKLVVEIQNEDEPKRGVIEFDQSSIIVPENSGAIAIKLKRSNGSDLFAEVNYTTKNGSAMAGKDYQLTSGTVRFESGETEKTILLNILNDKKHTGSREFSLELSGNYVGSANSLKIEIQEDDSKSSGSMDWFVLFFSLILAGHHIKRRKSL